MSRLFPRGLAAALLMVAAAPVARAADPDKLLPAESDTVISVNIKQVLESEIIKNFALEQLKQALQGNDAKKFLTDLGLDPLKDVERVVIGGSGKDQTDMKFLIIIHGKFDPEKLYKAAVVQTKKDGDHFSLVTDGQDKMFKFQPDNGNPVYGTVVDEGTVVLANDKKTVSTGLAAAAAGKKPAISRDLAGLIARMDDKSSLWMASVVKGKLDDVKIPNGPGVNPNLKNQLGQMETVSAYIRVTSDVNLDISLGMKDADAAEEMGKTVDEMLMTVRGLIPFLTAQDPKMKPLAEVGKTLKSSVKEKSVVISAKLSGTAIGQLVKPAGE